MAKSPKPKHISRRRLARQVERRKQRRLTLLITIGIVVVALGVVAYALLYNSVIVPNQPVASVGSETITTRDWQTEVRYQRLSLIRQYQQYYQIYTSLGMDPASQSITVQIQSQLNDPTTLGNSVLDQMIDDIVIKNQAAQVGITVTQAEVDQAMQAAFAYFPNGTPTPTISPSPFVTSTLNPTELFLVSPTPTVTGTATPTGSPTSTATLAPSATASLPASETPGGTSSTTGSKTPAETSTATASLTPTQTATPTASATAEPSPTASQIPSITPTLAPTSTPTTYTLAGYQGLVQTFVASANSEGLTGFTEADIRKIIEAQLYRQKMTDYINRDISDVQDEVWARHIVLPDQAAAEAALARLKGGEDWTKVAAQVSTDTNTKDTGGDLGWFPKGIQDAALEKAAFSLPVGQVSDPVQTAAGWEIIQVVGHEMRPLDANMLAQLKTAEFNTWLTGVKAKVTITKYDYYSQRIPTEPVLPTPFPAATPF